MKKIVEGKTYNTETAESIGGIGHYGHDGFYVDLYLRRGDKEIFGVLNSEADSDYSSIFEGMRCGYYQAIVLNFDSDRAGFDKESRTISLNEEYYNEFKQVTKNFEEEI